MWDIGKGQFTSWKDYFYSQLGAKINMSWKDKFTSVRKCKISLALVTWFSYPSKGIPWNKIKYLIMSTWLADSARDIYGTPTGSLEWQSEDRMTQGVLLFSFAENLSLCHLLGHGRNLWYRTSTVLCWQVRLWEPGVSAMTSLSKWLALKTS